MTRQHHYAAIAADPDGQMVLAIAHRGPDGPQLDAVQVLLVAGGAEGVAAVYRDLQRRGITLVPGRPLVNRPGATARQRAIRRVLAGVVAGVPAGAEA